MRNLTLPGANVKRIVERDQDKNRNTKKPAETLRDRTVQLAFEHGLLTLGCSKSTIRISPPLCITQQKMDKGLDILEEAITIAENCI